MSSSSESAIPVIMQWAKNGTSLKLHLIWDGIGMEVSDLRMELHAAPSEGFILRNPSGDFSMTFKRRGMRAKDFPGEGNRCVRVTLLGKASFILCES